MAVFDPNVPNLAPNYAGITGQLQQRADMELKRPGWEDAASQIVQRFDQEFTKQRDFEKKMAGEGRSLFTHQDAQELAKELGVPVESFRSGINRYYNQKEAEELIMRAMGVEGMSNIKKNVGRPGGMSESQYNALLASGEAGRTALAQSTFPRPVPGARPTLRLEDNEGNVREVPRELVDENFDQATFPWDKFPLAGFRKTVTNDPYSNDKTTVSGSGKVSYLTGPQRRDKSGLAKTGDQLTPKQKEYVVKRTSEFGKEVDKMRDQIQSAKDIEAQLAAGIPTSDAAVKSLMPRLMREVGNLNQQEQDIYDNTRAIVPRAKQFLERGMTGLYTAENREFLKKTAQIAKQVTEDRLRATGRRYAQQDRNIYDDIDEDFLINSYLSGSEAGGAQILGRRKAGQ